VSGLDVPVDEPPAVTPEAVWLLLRCDSCFVQRRKLCGLCLGGRDVDDRLDQPAVVAPVDPFEIGVLDGIERSP
jgi:hypothetical protein